MIHRNCVLFVSKPSHTCVQILSAALKRQTNCAQIQEIEIFRAVSSLFSLHSYSQNLHFRVIGTLLFIICYVTITFVYCVLTFFTFFLSTAATTQTIPYLQNDGDHLDSKLFHKISVRCRPLHIFPFKYLPSIGAYIFIDYEPLFGSHTRKGVNFGKQISSFL